MNKKTVTITFSIQQARALVETAEEGLAAEWNSLKDYMSGGRAGIDAAQRAVDKIRLVLPPRVSRRQRLPQPQEESIP